MGQVKYVEPLVQSNEVIDRDHLLRMVRKWGDVNTDGLLDKECHVFSAPSIEGFIGYKIRGSNAVVLGDPVCSVETRSELVHAFDEECHRKKIGIVYSMVSEEFVEWTTGEFPSISIEFGNKFIFDPLDPPHKKAGPNAVLVRKKVKQAQREGVVVHEYLGNDPAIENELDALSEAWVKKRQGPQVFLCGISLFEDCYGKRWFYAIHNHKIVGLVVLNELQMHQGWLLNNIILSFDAPKGLSELLIISTLEMLAAEGCRYVLAGPVPLHELTKINGIGTIKTNLMRLMFKYISSFFQLGGHSKFWEKFSPEVRGSYVLFPNRNLGISSIISLMKAFNASKS